MSSICKALTEECKEVEDCVVRNHLSKRKQWSDKEYKMKREIRPVNYSKLPAYSDLMVALVR